MIISLLSAGYSLKHKALVLYEQPNFLFYMEYWVNFSANTIFCQPKYLCRETWFSFSLPGFNPLFLSSFWFLLALVLEEKSYLIVAAICGGLCHICPISSVFSRLEGPGLLFLVWKWFQTLLIISQPLPVLLSIAEKDLGAQQCPEHSRCRHIVSSCSVVHCDLIWVFLSPFPNQF